MRPESLRLLLLSSALLLSACAASSRPSAPDAGASTEPLPAADAGAPPTDPPASPDAGTGPGASVTPSSRNHLRVKNPEQLLAHFAAALSLPPGEVCNELGQYSCPGQVHTVALGGVEPYGLGLYGALPVTGVTTPIVLDRMAWMACGRRVSLDLSQPGQAVLFKDLALDARGQLTDPGGAPVRAALTALYQRALLRDPTEAELETLSGLVPELATLGGPSPGRDWMVAACFTVLSSAESVFF